MKIKLTKEEKEALISDPEMAFKALLGEYKNAIEKGIKKPKFKPLPDNHPCAHEFCQDRNDWFCDPSCERFKPKKD